MTFIGHQPYLGRLAHITSTDRYDDAVCYYRTDEDLLPTRHLTLNNSNVVRKEGCPWSISRTSCRVVIRLSEQH